VRYLDGVKLENFDISFIKNNWHLKTGLLGSELAYILFIATVSNLLGLDKNFPIAFILLGNIAIWVCWLYSNKPPRTPNNKVGFLVSIYCSDEDDFKKIKEDLLVPLQQHIKGGNSGKVFHFMELQQHLAEKCLDSQIAQKVRIESGAQFMLFGRVRKRIGEDGEPHYFFDLEGAVAHALVSEAMSKRLSQEFTELLPRRVEVLSENDLFSFQFTSDWAGIVAKYIIGIAAAISGDIIYAEQLYDDVEHSLIEKNNSFPIFLKLKERLPVRRVEIYEAMASAWHAEWIVDYELSKLMKVYQWLQKVDPEQRSRPGVLGLYAICEFVLNKNVEKAITHIKKLEQPSNPIWQLNMAFLYGYKGQLKQAIRHYRNASQLNIQVDTINQVEGFINWILAGNPELIHLNYILGFFNWQIRGDSLLAKNNFESFLEKSDESSYSKERELTAEWIETIKTYNIA